MTEIGRRNHFQGRSGSGNPAISPRDYWNTAHGMRGFAGLRLVNVPIGLYPDISKAVDIKNLKLGRVARLQLCPQSRCRCRCRCQRREC